MADARLKGQEVEIRLVQAGQPLTTIAAIGSFNDSVMLETKQDGFLGEPVDRFDDILRGYSMDLEFQVTQAAWVDFQTAIIDRAQRKTPDMVFNVVRTDFYSNGDTLILTYKDVRFGAQPTSIASRGDFVKVKVEGKSSERTVQKNSLP
ncbi:MAG TPA: hypothetical protein PKI27_00685 [Dermatophilaceae bacterium]|jgi:hypothetical protein|nr:hypothetical protein [Dermatophilaceae bacterium]